MRKSYLRYGLLVALVSLLVLSTPTPSLSDYEKRSCWVEYAPGKVKDFRYFEDMDRGLNSRVVTYQFRNDTLNVYYKDQDNAKRWMAKVVRQLQGCN